MAAADAHPLDRLLDAVRALEPLIRRRPMRPSSSADSPNR